MSNPRFSMLNICSSLVLSFLCCFLWDSAKGGQVGLRENMLFSHTKNNHHNLITAFRNTSVSCFRVGICYCHRCAFCCSRSTKTHTKFHQFCQTGILWKSLASNMRVEGVSEFCGEIFRVPCGPEHASAEPCQGSPDGVPHSLLRPLHHPLHAGDSWLRGGEESFAVRAAGALCIIRGAQSAFSDPPWGCTGIPIPWFRMGPQRWPFLQQGEPQNIHTNETCVFSYLLCYWSRKSLAGCDWWYCAA